MILTKRKAATVFLAISVSTAASSPSDQTTALSECRLDVNQKNAAFKQLKEIRSDDDGYTGGPTYYDVKYIMPFGLAATQFTSDLLGLFPRYSYYYTTSIDSTFAKAKSLMLKSYGKSACDVSRASGSVKVCEISTGPATPHAAGGNRVRYLPKLELVEVGGRVRFNCQYDPSE